jgi:hypothetical protein
MAVGGGSWKLGKGGGRWGPLHGGELPPTDVLKRVLVIVNGRSTSCKEYRWSDSDICIAV